MQEVTRKDNNISSLEIVNQINLFRKKDGRSILRHSDLLKIIKEEFEEEINDGRVSQSFYEKETGNNTIRQYPMYILSLSQAKQLFVRYKARPTDEFIKKYNLDIHYTIKVKTRFEIAFGNMLIEALKELDLDVITQYNIDNKYRIDFYIPKKNIIIEYDEEQHFNETNTKKDLERQEYIENKLGCKFIRCDYRDSDIKNVMKVLKEVM